MKCLDEVELACQSHLHLLKEGKNRSFGETSRRDMMSAFMGHHMRAVCTVKVVRRIEKINKWTKREIITRLG